MVLQASILSKTISLMSDPIRFGGIHLGQDDSVHARPYTVLRASILPGRIPSMFDMVLRASILARITLSAFDPVRVCEHP